MIQGDLRRAANRVSIRMKVGDAGELSARDARAKARALLADIAAGKDPRMPAATGPRSGGPGRDAQ